MHHHHVFKPVIAALPVVVCVLAIAAAGGQSSPSAAAVRIAHPAQSTALPTGLMPALAQTLARHLPASWNLKRNAQGVAFSNPEQHLALNLDSQGLHLVAPKHVNLDMRLVDYAQGNDSAVLSAKPASQLDGTRVTLNRGAGLSEWYVNSPIGIEQGFTLARPLNGNGAAVLSFSLHGKLKPVLKNNNLEFQDAQGKPVLRYGELLAYDAAHHPLPAHMLLAGTRLTLNIDTRSARYPVSVDPLFSVTTTLQDPVSALNDEFGTSVTLSADGTTALIGVPLTMVSGQRFAGETYVFTAENGVWSNTASFPDPVAGANDFFGASVALSADGTTALIGAPHKTVSGQSQAGEAYVFTAVSGVWSNTASFPDPVAAANDFFGASVALSADGTTALIGADGTTVSGQSSAGEAYVLTAASGVWSKTASLPDPAAALGSFFGVSVALSADGTTALIGAYGTTVSGQSFAGEAYVFTAVSGVWSKTASLPDPAATSGDNFGYSVALAAGGATALSGAPFTTVSGQGSAGEAYVFTAVSGVWSKTASLPDPAAAANDFFGGSVALSADGTTALVGANGTTVSGQSFAGEAYIFTAASGIWSKTTSFPDPATAANDQFGGSVAFSADGTTAFVGAIGATVNGNANAGLMYVFASSVDLSLALTSNPGSVATGGSVTYMLTVTNSDTQVTASNLSLTDALPAGMTYVSSSAAGGSCAYSGGTVTCTLASLAPQATWQPSITVTAGTAGSITDKASVSGNQPDPNTANNTATVTISVTGPPPPPPPSSGGGGGGGLGLLSLLALSLLRLRKRTLRERREVDVTCRRGIATDVGMRARYGCTMSPWMDPGRMNAISITRS